MRAARDAGPLQPAARPTCWQTRAGAAARDAAAVRARRPARPVARCSCSRSAAAPAATCSSCCAWASRRQHLSGIELLPERLRAGARTCCPQRVRCTAATRCRRRSHRRSQDLVLQSHRVPSLLDDAYQQRLADAMWRWLTPGGAVLWYDFTVDNPRNPDVRGVPLARAARAVPAGAHRSTGASRWRRRWRARVCALHPRLYTVCSTPALLRTHVLAWIAEARMTASHRLPFLPFALPEIGDDEIAEVVDTLQSGWVTTGPKARRFEADFAPSSATRRCTASPSTRPPPACTWRSRRWASARATRSSPPPTPSPPRPRWCATSAPTCRLVDIDPATLNIDPAAVEAAITPRTKAILPVHYGGLAADMPALLDIARSARPEGGRGRRARLAHHLRRAAGRHAGQRRHRLQLLRQQDHHHRRGRHAGHARCGAGRSAPA